MKKRWILPASLALIAPSSAIASDCVVRVTTWGGSYQSTYAAVAPEFEKTYKCRVQWVVGASPDFMVKARLGQVDVVTNTLPNSVAGEKEGLWMAFDEAKIPNSKNLYPNARYSPQTYFANVGDFALVYNSKYIKDEPTSWDALWGSGLKGRVTLYYFDSAPTLGLTLLQAAKHGGSIENIDPGLTRLKELSAKGNLIGMLDVESQMVSLFELEEAWIGMLGAGRIKDLWDKGATSIKLARPKEGTVGLITTVNIVKNTPNPEMAHNFVNFVLSKTAQEAFATRNLYGPTVTNAVIPEDFKYKDLLVTGDAVSRLFVPDQARVNELKGKWRERFDRLMTQ
jgi:Spermidine/putrescine-binding periplasmic protein